MNDFYFERLSEENFSKFYHLFCTVFDKKTPYDFLYKKYNTGYLGGGLKYVGFVAFNQNQEAVSYCGTIPFAFKINGQSYIGAHSCDHMTRSDARKKGLFVKLNDLSDALCEELGIDFVFGFPNQNNHPILVKYAQWEIIDTTQAFEIPVSGLPVSSLANRTSLLKNVYQKFVKNQLQSKLSQKPIERNWNGIIRDDAFYSYKKYSPNYVVQLKNGKVWLKVKGVIFIGDLELNPSGDFQELLNELKKLAFQLGIRKIIFLASSNFPIVQQFAKHFTAKSGNGIGVKRLQKQEKIDLHQLQFTLGDYDTF